MKINLITFLKKIIIVLTKEGIIKRFTLVKGNLILELRIVNRLIVELNLLRKFKIYLRANVKVARV